MAHPVLIPRVNNNDDTVKIAQLIVGVGDAVHIGDLILEVETEKATVAIEAEFDGYVLVLNFAAGEEAPVGAVIAWIGATPDEQIPACGAGSALVAAITGDTTAKARLLLSRHNLTADRIPRSGDRLTAKDVENYLTANPAGARMAALAISEPLDLPAPASVDPLSPHERGMLATVSWQRDNAAAAYLEIEYDPLPWEIHAAAYSKEMRLLVSPKLALLAHRLARLAPEHGANGSMTGEARPRRICYRQVNLGFTVQAGEMLYICVVEAADQMGEADFVVRLLDLQRRAIAHKLAPSEMRGATVAFTSMARWGVRRHIPILAPHTALMVAHTAKSSDGTSEILGATYDHRVLSGFDVARLLKSLTRSPGKINPAEETQ